MNINKKFNKQVLDILEKILENYLYFGYENKKASYRYSNKEWYDPKIEEHMIIEKLEFWGAIKDIEYDNKNDEEHFTIIEPKFNETYKRFEKLNIKNKIKLNTKAQRQISYLYENSSGKLEIFGYENIFFEKLPAKILEYFYNLPDKQWRDYDQIKTGIMSTTISSHDIRRAIISINNRIVNKTKGRFRIIDDNKQDQLSTDSRKPLKYRWGL